MDRNLLSIHRELINDCQSEWSVGDRSEESNKNWRDIRDQGSELWLDTGSINQAGEHWTDEFSGLTTNNALLNDVVQGGDYDDVIIRAASRLRDEGYEGEELIREIGFLLNALHGKRLVEQFDCRVSVELHTDLAHDVEGTVQTARRFHQLESDYFIIKVPFTAEGVVAARRLRKENIPINQTVAFSVRQNYVIGRVSRASYGNVFLGRLNGLFEKNHLPDVKRIGEKVTLASHKTLKFLRKNHDSPTRQIAASIRSGDQVMNLGGVDVLTIPPSVAGEYLELVEENRTTGRLQLRSLLDQASEKPGDLLTNLVTVNDDLRRAVDELLDDGETLTSDRLRNQLIDAGLNDLFPAWSEDQVQQSSEEGKIPDLSNWEQELNDGVASIDSLMSLAGLQAFSSAQADMDERIKERV